MIMAKEINKYTKSTMISGTVHDVWCSVCLLECRIECDILVMDSMGVKTIGRVSYCEQEDDWNVLD